VTSVSYRLYSDVRLKAEHQLVAERKSGRLRQISLVCGPVGGSCVVVLIILGSATGLNRSLSPESYFRLPCRMELPPPPTPFINLRCQPHSPTQTAASAIEISLRVHSLGRAAYWPLKESMYPFDVNNFVLYSCLSVSSVVRVCYFNCKLIFDKTRRMCFCNQYLTNNQQQLKNKVCK
jgi:hypothetical protein